MTNYLITVPTYQSKEQDIGEYYLLPEKQKLIPWIKKNVENKPRLVQGKAGIKHKSPNRKKKQIN